MNFWLDLFTSTTWDEFKQGGARLSGFRASQKKNGAKNQAGRRTSQVPSSLNFWIKIAEYFSA
jgi:hypothetical protein